MREVVVKYFFVFCVIFLQHFGIFTMVSTEFSFVIKACAGGGIGVFATHDIAKGTLLFATPFALRRMMIQDVPVELLKYVIYVNDQECITPERFDRMEIGWYINHSHDGNIGRLIPIDASKNHEEALRVRSIHALKDIKAGEEILIDYNNLQEPEHLKQDYYRKA
jgi:hypothetical protein